MKFNQALNETTLWTHGGGKKTKHDSKRSKFAHKDLKNIHLKDYEKAVKNGTSYFAWVHPIKTKI